MGEATGSPAVTVVPGCAAAVSDGAARSSSTVSQAGAERFADVELARWSSEVGLSGIDASAPMTHTATWPSGVAPAWTTQSKVVALPRVPGCEHAGCSTYLWPWAESHSGPPSEPACTHRKFAGNGPARLSVKPIRSARAGSLTAAAPPASCAVTVGAVRSIVVDARRPRRSASPHEVEKSGKYVPVPSSQRPNPQIAYVLPSARGTETPRIPVQFTAVEPVRPTWYGPSTTALPPLTWWLNSIR